MDDLFKPYATLSPKGIPDIPCIDAFQFVNQLAEGEHIVNFREHLLSASKEDYKIIQYVVRSHNYMTRTIERFQYGTIPNNEYVYFFIE